MPNFWVLYTLYFRNDRAQQSELIIFTLCVCVFFYGTKLWQICLNLSTYSSDAFDTYSMAESPLSYALPHHLHK